MAAIQVGNSVSLTFIIQHYVYVAIEDARPLGPHNLTGDKVKEPKGYCSMDLTIYYCII